MPTFTQHDLERLGYTLQPDGSYSREVTHSSHPARIPDPKPEPAIRQTLDCQPPRKATRTGRVTLRITRHACRLLDALILGWLIGATDAHAKNFSVLIAAGAQVRLAPLYDISSALPYPTQVDLHRANLAMRIGGTYRLREIGKRDWEKFAVENKISLKMLHDRIEHLMDVMPQKCSAVADTLAREGITHAIVELLVQSIGERVSKCREEFVRGGTRH